MAKAALEKYANLAGAGDRSHEPSGREEFHICLGEELAKECYGFIGDEGMFDGRTLERLCNERIRYVMIL